MPRRERTEGRRSKARPDLHRVARKLRREQSVCETILWRELRGGRFGDLKFRRQHPIGRYVVDFACVELMLVIEVDGVTHEDTVEADAERSKLIESLGFEVVRFTNDDVCNHLKGVLRGLDAVCVRRAATPSPQPSPPDTGERGQEALP